MARRMIDKLLASYRSNIQDRKRYRSLMIKPLIMFVVAAQKVHCHVNYWPALMVSPSTGPTSNVEVDKCRIGSES